MTYASEMRALSFEEIDAVAGAGYCPPAPPPSSGGNITVTQSNYGTASATSWCGCATAFNVQTNVANINSPIKIKL